MSRRTLVNALLAGIVLVLAALALWRPTPVPTGTAPPFTTLDPATITTLRLTRNGQTLWALARGHHGWRMTAPRPARANRHRVSDLLGLLTHRGAVALPHPASLDDADLGLSPPRATLYFNDTRLEVGAAHPLSPRSYVRLDESVWLVPDDFTRQLLATAEDLLDPAPLAEASDILRVRLPGRSLTHITKTRGAGQSWQLEPPDNTISADDVQRYLDDWRHAQALQVTPASGNHAASSRDIIEITVNHTGKPTHLRFTHLARTPAVILIRQDEGLAYHFAPDVGARLLAGPSPVPSAQPEPGVQP